MNGVGLRRVMALLNDRVQQYQLRQMMMPSAQGRGRMLTVQMNVLRGVEGIEELIAEDKPFERRSYERMTLPTEKRCLKSKVIIQDDEHALEEAKLEREGLVLWTDGSRKEDEWVGYAVVWKERNFWKKRRVHAGRQKEVFDAERYAMSEAMKIADEMAVENEVRRVTVFTDSQATLRQTQSDKPGPGQVLALRMMNWVDALARKNIQVEYWWVPAHKGIEGNEEADQLATKAEYKYCRNYTENQNPLGFSDYVSFSHISLRLTKTKWEETNEEIQEMGKKSKHSYRYNLMKMGGNSAVMNANKTIAARFYQLKSEHGLIVRFKYLMQIGKRRDLKCWWCGHEYQTRDHLFKWCKRWKQEQKRLWVDGQEGEDGYEGVKKVLKKSKISLPMSLVFAEEKCSQALMDFLFHTDVGRISGIVEEAENSDHEE